MRACEGVTEAVALALETRRATARAKRLAATKSTTYTRQSDAEELARVTVYLPKELFTRAKVSSVKTGVPFSDYVARALRAALKAMEEGT